MKRLVWPPHSYYIYAQGIDCGCRVLLWLCVSVCLSVCVCVCVCVACIVKELRKDGISTTHRTVTWQIFQWTKGGRLQDQHRPGQPSVITEEISEYLNKMLEDNDELSACEFHRLIMKKFSVQIPAPTILRFLRLKLNWVTVRPFQEVLNRPLVLPRVDLGHYNCTDSDIFWIDEDVLHFLSFVYAHACMLHVQLLICM